MFWLSVILESQLLKWVKTMSEKTESKKENVMRKIEDETKVSSNLVYDRKENIMRKIMIEKITLNIGTGNEGNVDHAIKVLKELTGMKAKSTISRKRNPFGGLKGKIIGCMVTVRKDKQELLKRLLESVENKVPLSSFDSNGNFSFGIKEYISIPGMRYDPDIGIIGMDACVTLVRPGFKIKNKRLPHKVGKKHLITKEEGIEFAKSIGIETV